MVDHTGERWRVREWALAEPRALGGLPLGWQLWRPVDCVGDLGAAFFRERRGFKGDFTWDKVSPKMPSSMLTS